MAKARDLGDRISGIIFTGKKLGKGVKRRLAGRALSNTRPFKNWGKEKERGDNQVRNFGHDG